MSGVWQENIVRLCSGDGQVLGTGTLVLTSQNGLCVLTCAHVLNAALGRDDYSPDRPDVEADFLFDLPVRSRDRKYHAKLLEWWPPLLAVERVAQPVGDIALLKIVEDIPASVRPYSADDLVVDELEDRLVRSFGFSQPNGEFAAGRLLGNDAGGWVHFAAESAHESFVAPGFSGAPLFDEERQFIAGMVVAVDDDADRRVAYALGTQLIWTACPQLARPYRGLRDFGERDRAFFFGRKTFVSKLREKLRTHPIVCVAGASGSGKSSVVKAGLIPELRTERNWTVLKMRPAADPWAELAKELVSLLYEVLPLGDRLSKEEELAQKLRDDPLHLGVCLSSLAKAQRTDNVLVFVDQLEELFTLAGHEAKQPVDGEVAKARGPDFRDLMIRTATLKGTPSIQWIYTLRADFAGQAYRYPAFVEALKDGEEKLADMNGTELRQSIVEPARKLDVTFEEGIDGGPSLSERIVDAVEARPGSLPLMAHLLEKLWEQLEHRKITHAAYDHLGGLEGALDRHADEVFERLTDEQRLRVRQLMSRLVKVEEGNEPTRRVRTRAELGEELWEVAGWLAAPGNWLLVIRGTDEGARQAAEDDAQAQRQTVEVAHEALLRNWGKFRDWLKQDLAFLLWRQRLGQQLADFTTAKYKSGLHLSGAPLEAALDWLKSRKDDISADEQQFILTSKDEQDRIAAEKERAEAERRAQSETILRQQAELIERQRQAALERENAEAERQDRDDKIKQQQGELIDRQIQQARKQRQLIGALLATAVMLVGAVFVFLYLNNQTGKALEALENATAALADGLIRQGKSVTAIQVLRAGLGQNFSEDGVKRKPATYAVLVDALSHIDQDPGILRGHAGPLTGASFSADGTRVVTTSDDHTARLWDALSGRLLHTLQGHSDTVYAASFSADGTRIVTASSDHTARVWDTTTGRLLLTLSHDDRVTTASFSADGARIVTASGDHIARVWGAATGKLLQKLEGHDAAVNAASFSVDGTRIVTASSDGTARVWDAVTGQPLHKLKGYIDHIDIVYAASFSADGARIVTASGDHIARVWDATTGKLLHKLEGHTGAIYSASFSRDGKLIVTASDDLTAGLWDVASGRLLQSLTGHTGPVTAAAFSPNGTRIVTASVDNTARLWDETNGQLLKTMEGHTNVIYDVSFSPDGRRIVTASGDMTARLWDATSGQALGRLVGHVDIVTSASFSPDGSLIVTTSRDKTARLWNAARGQFLWNAATFPFSGAHGGDSGGLTTAAFSSDGTRIVTGSSDATARLWDAGSHKLLRELTGHTGRITAASFSLDGTRIATASIDGTACVWDATSGHLLLRLGDGASPIYAATFSPDGTRIVTASHDTKARSWDATSGHLLGTLEGHIAPVTSASFSPDGTRIVTGSADNTARLWDAASGQPLKMLEGHHGAVVSASFSPDGTRIVTASDDHTARVWDAASGRLLQTLEGHTEPVNSASFSPDGTRIVTASDDHTARLWNVSPVTYSVLPGGSINWTAQPSFSKALIDNVNEQVPQGTTESDKHQILTEQ